MAMTSPVSNEGGATNGNGHANGKIHQLESLRFETKAIHVGSEPSEDTGALIPAISLSTTFLQHGVGGFKVSKFCRRTRRTV
jgi:cystathionine gamma-lyase